MIIPATIHERNEFLSQRIYKYAGKEFECKALNAKILITNKSIKETIHHAAKSNKSTILALRLPTVIKNARFIGFDLPKKGNQHEMGFILMAKMISVIPKIGIAKLMIGIRTNYKKIEYSITALDIEERS